MTGIVCRKSQKKSVTPVTSDYIRILSIPETSDMNMTAGWFFSEKLAYYSRNQSKTNDYYEVNKMTDFKFHFKKISNVSLISTTPERGLNNFQ
jgi:hypothetical protein